MLQITRQSDYAIQLVNRLAKLEPRERLSLRPFSRESNISFLFLQKIARQLKQARIIEATLGPSGGYRLKKPAKSISLKDIVEAVEGACGIVDCLKAESVCNKMGNCQSRKVWKKVNTKILKMLNDTLICSR